jgi:hypothetical protein
MEGHGIPSFDIYISFLSYLENLPLRFLLYLIYISSRRQPLNPSTSRTWNQLSTYLLIHLTYKTTKDTLNSCPETSIDHITMVTSYITSTSEVTT